MEVPSSSPGQTPLFSFGVIADVQFADINDGFNFTGTNRRYYRSSLKLLYNALRTWSQSTVRPTFILQLGDLIDGVNKRTGASQRALDTVLAALRGRGPAQVHHVWGNHELYNFQRSELLLSELNSAPQGHTAIPGIYAYLFRPMVGFVFVVLDGYDVSPLGREEHSEEYQSALRLLRQSNSKQDLNSPPPGTIYDMFSPRFTMFNGGFSQDQLDWLDHVLCRADQDQDKVTIICHLPVHPLSTSRTCLAWNYEQLLAVIRAHTSVVCYMAGHDHDGGYCHDEETGVHYVTFEGVIETPPDSDAFSTVYVYRDRMVLEGRGRTPHREMVFP
ncbi:manganese-dependent ADP-ribose/CDP-alcohol diphosphatase isoform X2 [Gouania willdenowi]|uniref:Calcineurin-like phosphoesterase domain-containing protein n=1 Tax=Gouania willdenowi TaxID=441366 RepID=A0A8C5DGZ3_GOUWI|nr:manganese-dependent ADP-ribose/CDP-alcohol diphosphatase isoform X2 [Gouania willdenowi]